MELSGRRAEVLRIPADGSKLEIIKVDTRLTPLPYSYDIDAHTFQWEAKLGHVPDLRHWDRLINMDCRHIFCLNDLDDSFGIYKRCYFIVKCINPCIGSGLELGTNEFFKDVKDACVYGDAFVFASNSSRIEVNYDDGIGVDFWRSLHVRGRARTVVEILARLKRPTASVTGYPTTTSLSAYQYHAGPSQYITQNPTAKEERRTITASATQDSDTGSSALEVKKPYIQPKLQVLFFTNSSAAVEIIPLNLARFGKQFPHALDARTAGLEARLGHVPNLSMFPEIIHEEDRFLFGTRISDAPASSGWNGKYMMYKCTNRRDEAGQKISKNKHFENIKHARVYGDAIVFRLSEPREANSSGEVLYRDIESGFVDDYNNKGVAYQCVKELARKYD